jgi:hypothetical protein
VEGFGGALFTVHFANFSNFSFLSRSEFPELSCPTGRLPFYSSSVAATGIVGRSV